MVLLDFVHPDEKMGVHTYDILTIKMPDGSVQIVSCLLWAECSGDTSHSTSLGCSVDVYKEQIVNGIGHYSAHFAANDIKNTKWYGMKVQKVKEACETVVKTHELINNEYDWVQAIGWDCMLDSEGDMIFFEGNQANYRLPRIMHVHPSNMFDFIY